MNEPDGLTVFVSALTAVTVLTLFVIVGAQFLAGHGQEIIDRLRSRKPER